MRAPRGRTVLHSVLARTAVAWISAVAVSAQSAPPSRPPAPFGKPSTRDALHCWSRPWAVLSDWARSSWSATDEVAPNGAPTDPPSISQARDREVYRPLIELIETVPVGNPGNPPDPRGYGAVPHSFAIAKHEVTAGTYIVFLNAVAATDPHGLYNPNMTTHVRGCNLQRAGASGSFTYSVAPDWADRPVNFVSWGDAARFANWLHNGLPRGPQDLTTTEDGAYFLDGALGGALDTIEREPDAIWAIPSEDEWYKAAYHFNDGVTANYFNYATGNQSAPSNQLVAGGQNHATYFDGSFTIGAPYYRTEVGAHAGSPSPYGTFDQGGNVQEWNDSIVELGSRGLRGGSFFWGISELFATSRTFFYHSDDEFDDIGFRVAKVR